MNLIKPSFSTGYAKNASESANPNLWKGLVGAWMPSFGVTGGTLKDVSGNGNDAALTTFDPSSDWTATNNGIALNFNQDYATIGYEPSLSVPEDASIVANLIPRSGNLGSHWIYAGGFQFGLEFDRSNSSAYSLIWNNGSSFYILYATETINYGTFQSVVGLRKKTSSGFNAQIWVNGKNILNTTTASSTTAAYGSSYIGSYFAGNTQSPSAKLMSLELYNRALSPTEIKQLYLNPSAPFQKKTTTVVSVPAAPVTTTAKAVVLKKPKPSYATGYARNASESANPNLWKGLEMAFVPDTTVLMKDRSGHGRSVVSKTGDPQLTTLSGKQALNPQYPTSLNSLSVKAVEFDGNDGLNIDAKGFTRSAGQPLSCFTVYQRTDSAGQHVVGCRNGSGSGDLWSIGNNALTETFFRYDPTGSGAKITVSDLGFRNTYAICGVYNGNRLQLYVNGVKRAESAFIPNAFIDQSDYRIGYSNTSPEYFYGKIGPTYIYSKALTASEIKKLTANPLAPFERKQQTVGISTAQAFNPYWANQATQLAGTLQ